MIQYNNLNFHSSVLSYDYGEDYITIEWLNGNRTTFRHNEVGKRHVDKMIMLAKKGRGLYSYIEKNKRYFKPKKKIQLSFPFFK